MPAWPEVQLLVARQLGERVSPARPLTPAKQSGVTWAARAQGTGAIVVKVRESDDGRAAEKAQWCAAHLPALGARGYPVPAILWHGMISADWQVTVQSRLPGRPVVTLDGPVLEEAMRLVELQAGARIADESRDFTGYVANVLFDWDEVWATAPGACAAAGPLCARLRRWLEPVWGLRLPGQLPGDRRAGLFHPRAAGVRRVPGGCRMRRRLGHPRPAPGARPRRTARPRQPLTATRLPESAERT
jgi:hypothetical protein